ncbi:MAG: type II toxin-antitoxin system VapC family toxin [Planctomycetes bacterium]|nr:type II toxin-antitoxin system VapC family toxin [Planctomycetota bacterium]
MILLDTDHLSALTNRNHRAHTTLLARIDDANEPIAVPVVCVEEQCKGWLARINRLRDVEQQSHSYEHLKQLFYFFREWEIASFDSAAALIFSNQRKQKLRIGSQDLKIASIALAQNAVLLSANLRDFRKVRELSVENWLEL